MVVSNYVSIARFDHWPKQIFAVAGVLIALILAEEKNEYLYANIVFGLLCICFAASANYILNEWLDRDYDKFHPIKKFRPAPSGLLTAKLVYLEYLLFIVLSIFVASYLSFSFLFSIVLLLLSGLIYNVNPIRTKDITYLDVLSEALNNPLRLALGWFCVSSNSLPPSSLLIIFWLGGSFLMAIKRFAEFRLIQEKGALNSVSSYRKSFEHYTLDKLLLFSFMMALLSAFFFAAFIVKYRAEYILILPLASLLFTYYLNLALKENSIVQTPEKLFKDWGLNSLVLLIIFTLTVLTFIDIPFLQNYVYSASIFELSFEK